MPAYTVHWPTVLAAQVEIVFESLASHPPQLTLTLTVWHAPSSSPSAHGS